MEVEAEAEAEESAEEQETERNSRVWRKDLKVLGHRQTSREVDR